MFFSKKEPQKPDKANAMRTLVERISEASAAAVVDGADLRAVAAALEDSAAGLRLTDACKRPIF
jgi:hypothetical protein